MDERVMQFRVGVVFLATLLITTILLLLLNKLPNVFGRTYPVQVRFDYAGGVTKGFPVRKNGVRIGKVSDVQLADQDSRVLVTLAIDADKVIYHNEECVISRDLVGNTNIEFGRDLTQPGPGKPIAADTILTGRYSDDPTGLKRDLKEPIDTVKHTGEALTAASEKLGKAADRVAGMFDPDAEKDAKSLLHDAATSLRSIQNVLGDDESRKKLTDAMQKLPDTLDNMNTTFKSTDEALRKFTQRSTADGKTPIDRMVGTIEMTERTMRKFSEPSANGEPAPADQIAKAMENFSEITTLIRSIMERIDRGEGSVGALMNDRQLYDRLNCAAKNIEDVSFRLKPIVEDARVFMDKAARHPGVIVRDAVKPGVGLK